MTDEALHCNSCNLDFKNNTCYKKHFKTSRHIQRSTNANIVVFSCICGRSYSYHQSLYVHHKKCPQYQQSKKANPSPPDTENVSLLVKQLQTEKDEMREKLVSFEKEHEEMKAQIAMLLDKHAGTTNNNNTTNNNIETQNINIIINSFGKENTDYIDNKSYLASICKVYKSIPSILEKIHFDPNHPENHNIKITNKKLPYASVMGINQKWKTVDRKDAIETMVLNGYNMLDEKYAENKEKISSSKQQNFEGFQSKFESEDKDMMKQIKTEVDMMVLNGGG